MGERCWELVAANKSAAIAKPLLDVIVMEDGQCDGCFANPSGTYESNRFEVFSETDNLLDELIAPKKVLGWKWGEFSMYTGCNHETTDSLMVEIANLF